MTRRYSRFVRGFYRTLPIAALVALPLAGLRITAVGEDRRDACAVQVLNSEERIRDDIAQAKRVAGDRRELQAMLRGIDAMEVRLFGLPRPWDVAVLPPEDVQP